MAQTTRSSSPGSKKPKPAPTKSAATKAPASRKATAALPGVPPRKKVAPPPLPPPSPQASLTEATRAMDALRAKAWGAATALKLSTPAGVAVDAVAQVAPRPHWVLLTKGLLPRGFELSLRTVRAPEHAAPPPWTLALLDELVRAQEQGASLGPGQLLPLAAGTAPELGNDFRAVTLGLDPKLGEIVVAGAHFPVLAIVALARDEERMVREWSPLGLLEVMAKVDPLWVLDPDRSSLLASPRARTAIESRAEREGSAMEAAWARQSHWVTQGGGVVWTLSVDGVESLVSLLKGRTAHLRSFQLRSAEGLVEVHAAQAPSVAPGQDRLVIALSQTAGRVLRSQLRAAPGTYRAEALPQLTISVP